LVMTNFVMGCRSRQECGVQSQARLNSAASKQTNVDLENEPESESEVVLNAAIEPDRIVINLDQPQLNTPGEADVQTLAGKPARLRIPPLTQNGQMFRLKGYGMPSTGKTDDKGDLYARVEAELPTQLTSEEREHYEALAKKDTKHSAA